MNQQVKLGLYIVFTIGACLFGYFAVNNYMRIDQGVQRNAQNTGDASVAEEAPSGPHYEGLSRAGTLGVLFFVMIIGLGLLIAHDISQYFGNRALKVLYNDEGVGITDPEYERAEQVWADGNHLEAISLMREYLQKNPREQHVALRIAEIYEKDLQNFLAAALEYEDVLQKNLPRERWGWAAIHLCNLYLKLGQQEKMLDLLRRLDTEYGETQAAEKARKRLALYEGEGSARAPLDETAAEDGRQNS